MHSLFTKLEEIAWYCFLIILPLQTRHIFGFESWGFVEWNAISLYASDLILGFLLLAAIGKGWRTIRFTTIDFLALALAGAAALSIRNSSHQALSVYHWVKLIEGIALFWYVRHYAICRFDHISSLIAFILGAFLQALIGIGQFIAQRDLGLWFLGESMLSPHLKGIASFYISLQEKVIRAYGTTPHPNILATYLAIAIFAYWYWFIKAAKTAWIERLSLLAYGVLIFGLLMTFSRTVIFGWAVAIGIMKIVMLVRSDLRAFLVRERKRVITLGVATAFFFTLFAGMYWPEISARFTIASDEEAVTLRLYYNKQAFRTGDGGLNWSGVGIGNFVNWFTEATPGLARYLYQPVHNVYLLTYSETGILGGFSFLIFLSILVWQFLRTKSSNAFGYLLAGASLGIILFVGIFDHFPWTLQQGRLLFWLILGVASAGFDAQQ